MATCTLDDLVPRIKCEKVYLEPIQELDLNGEATGDFDYGKYKVRIYTSILDKIDEHDEGIADFILDSGNFQQYVHLHIAFSRNGILKSFVDFLTSYQSGYREILGTSAEYGYNDGHKSLLYHFAVLAAKPGMYHEMAMNGLSDPAAYMQTIESETDSFLATGNPFGGDSANTYESNFYKAVRDYANAIMSDFLVPTLGDSQFIPTANFIGKYIRYLFQMIGSFEMIDFKMSEYDTFALPDPIPRTQDEDGNTYYKVSSEFPLTFENDISVEECYAHMHGFLDIEQVLSEFGVTQTVPVHPGIEFWHFNTIDECAILNNKRPASPMVVDFRVSERIEELIRSDFITAYDATIDMISEKSSEFQPADNSITSRLYTSYVASERLSSSVLEERYIAETRNYFYINFLSLLKRKSRLSWVYALAETSGLMDMNAILETAILQSNYAHGPGLIRDMHIDRIRVDTKDDPKRILEKERIISMINANANIIGSAADAHMFKFVDDDFGNLTDGEYIYKFELEIRDPLYAFIRAFTSGMKIMIRVLKEAIEWIHHNPQNYSEIRGELNLEAREYLVNLFNAADPTSEFALGYMATESMMAMFTGTTMSAITVNEVFFSLFTNLQAAEELENDPHLTEDQLLVKLNEMFEMDQYIAQDAFTNIDKIDRRTIENLHRIANDLLFGISKHVDASIINQFDESNFSYAGDVTATEYIDYSRTWKYDPVKANMDYRMMISVQRNQTEELNDSAILAEFREEIQKHVGLATSIEQSQVDSMNFLTPRSVGSRNINYVTIDNELVPDSKVDILEASVRKPAFLKSEMINGLYDYVAGEYSDVIGNLKNDSGIFESLLGELGTTIKNKTAEALNTEPSTPLRFAKERVFGLDFGESVDSPVFSGTEEEEEEVSEDSNMTRDEIKEKLFLEKIKLEHIVMNVLVDTKGHHLLDRRDFTQGTRASDRFQGFRGYEIYQNVLSRFKPHPRQAGHYLRDTYWRQSYASTTDVNPIKVIASRFVADNTFLLYYLEGFDLDMNPRWVEFIYRDYPDIIARAASLNHDRVFCKLERFRMTSEFTNIGQGSASDLEITNKYFYLTV